MIMDDDSVKGLVSTWSLAAKPCDSCKTSPAILFCRPHSAFLCAACDADLHPNLLHERVLICDVCEQFPADVTCKADSAALCAACDRHIHSANPLAGRHHRLPVLPFFQTPSAAFDTNWPNDVSSFLDFNLANLSHETPCTRSFVADSEAKSITYPDGYGYAGESCFQIDFSQSKYNHSAQSISHTVSSSESGVVPEGASYSGAEVSNSTNSYDGLSVQTLQATEMDRRARVMRYREKKKRRKFQKTIRYASRKAYAERRPRVKGRFAKRIDADSDAHREVVEQIGFVVDHGVVPLF